MAAGAPREMSPHSDFAAGDAIAPALVADLEPSDRKLVFHASLAIQTGDASAAEREIRATVQEAQGWIHRVEGATFTLRVPAERFDTTLARLATLGRVLDRKIGAADVTDEHRDFELRLANAEQVRARLAALLEKAKDVKETLEVERELARVTEEIERLKGKLKQMADAVAVSTIVVALQRAPTAAAVRAPRFPFAWVRRLGVDDLLEMTR
jgi:hypothetical protein